MLEINAFHEVRDGAIVTPNWVEIFFRGGGGWG